jgi:hypothetical protein
MTDDDDDEDDEYYVPESLRGYLEEVQQKFDEVLKDALKRRSLQVLPVGGGGEPSPLSDDEDGDFMLSPSMISDLMSSTNPAAGLRLSQARRMAMEGAPTQNSAEIPTKKGDTTEWDDVPKNSAENASGQLQVRPQETDSSKRKTKDETDWPPLVVHSTELMAPEDTESQNRIACLEEEVEHLKKVFFNSKPFAQPKNKRNSILPAVQFLQEEVKTLIEEKEKLLNNIQHHTNTILGERISVKLTVIQGTGFVVKDPNLIGQKTSSDPYVEVWASTSKMISTFIGKTATIEKTVDPIWNERFDLEPRHDNPKVTLKIWDEDYSSEPDAMGVATIEIPTKPGDTTEWYDIPESSANNASGKLQVRLETAMVANPKSHIEHLEKEVERLYGDLSRTAIAAPAAKRNSLEPTMEFLQQQHKDLLKEKTQLQH